MERAVQSDGRQLEAAEQEMIEKQTALFFRGRAFNPWFTLGTFTFRGE